MKNLKKIAECDGKYYFDDRVYTLDYISDDGVHIYIEEDSGMALIGNDNLEIYAEIYTWEGQGMAFLDVNDVNEKD